MEMNVNAGGMFRNVRGVSFESSSRKCVYIRLNMCILGRTKWAKFFLVTFVISRE